MALAPGTGALLALHRLVYLMHWRSPYRSLGRPCVWRLLVLTALLNPISVSPPSLLSWQFTDRPSKLCSSVILQGGIFQKILLKLGLEIPSICSLVCSVLRQRGFSLIRSTIRHVLGKHKGKATRILSGRIGSALVCVHQKAQYHDIKLPVSPRFMFITVVMSAVSTSRPTDCLESHFPFSSQTLQPHQIFSTHQMARGKKTT